MIGILIAAGGLGHLASEAFVPSVERARDSYARNAANMSSNQNSAARIEIDPAELDFGERQVGTSATATLTIHNRGVDPVQVANIISTCGCTTSKAPAEPIKPGDSAQVEVRMNVSGPAGRTTKKSLAFVFDDDRLEPIRVPVSSIGGEFIALSGDEPLYSPDEAIYELRIRATDGKVFRVIRATPNILESRSSSSAIEHVLRLDGDRWRSLGKPGTFLIELDHPRASVVKWSMRRPHAPNRTAGIGDAKEPQPPALGINPRRVSIGTITAGAPTTVEMQITGSSAADLETKVEDVFVSAPSFTTRLAAVSSSEDGIELSIELTPKAGVVGRVREEIEIRLTDGSAARCHLYGTIITAPLND